MVGGVAIKAVIMPSGYNIHYVSLTATTCFALIVSIGVGGKNSWNRREKQRRGAWLHG